MVILSRIYTRTGDAGQTRLSNNEVTSKTDSRVEAYGQVDEANSAIGVALAGPGLDPGVREVLGIVQNELFDVGADLSTPMEPDPKWPPLRIEQSSIDRLEGWCDQFGDPLPVLHSFILPGGSPAAAQLHVCRTIARRAERAAWRAAQEHGLAAGADDLNGGINPLAITYLNRLSDLLFILARNANLGGQEILWVPGGERNATQAPPRKRIDDPIVNEPPAPGADK